MIQGNIRYYTSKNEELAYPNKLVSKWYFIYVTSLETSYDSFFLAVRKPQTGLEIKEKESVGQFFQQPSLDKLGEVVSDIVQDDMGVPHCLLLCYAANITILVDSAGDL